MGMLTEFLWSMMIFLLAVRIMGIVVRLLTNRAKTQEKIPSQETMEKEEKAASIEIVQDIVCGNDVPKHKAYQVIRDNGTHYFCSWNCRQKFIAEDRIDL